MYGIPILAVLVVLLVEVVLTGAGQPFGWASALVFIWVLLASDLERPFLAPGGRPGAWLITILATGWSLLVTACLLWPGLGTADPDAALPAGFEGQRLQFELLVLAPLATVVAACTVFHLANRRSG